MADRFLAHEIQWTREKSARFWDYLSSAPGYRENNFSKLAGEALLKLLQRRGISLAGPALDFGCGPGFLMDFLLKRGISCQGAEFSAVAAGIANERLENHPLFKGVAVPETLPLPFADESFGAVFLIEAIEHLPPEELNPALSDIYRVLKKGGHLIITTPNEENLERGKILCPECGAIFHRGQHLSAWGADSLAALLAGLHFRKAICEAANFHPPSRLNALRGLVERILKRKRINLVYVGQK